MMTLMYFDKVHNSMFCNSASYHEGTRFDSHPDWGILWFSWVQVMWWGQCPENTMRKLFQHKHRIWRISKSKYKTVCTNIHIYANKNMYTLSCNSIFWALCVLSVVYIHIYWLFFTFPHNWIIAKSLWFTLSLYEMFCVRVRVCARARVCVWLF
jgi:hypothetical protein